MRKRIFHTIIAATAAVMALVPLGAPAQTARGDFNYDGVTSVSDLTFLIDYLLMGRWNEQPMDLQRDTITVNGVSFVMVHVDGGSYSPSEGVTVTVGDFSIGKTEVTRELWKAVMGGTATTDLQLPVNQKSWNDCQEFIARLNELTGMNFRLPKDREWEFAARGGNRSKGYIYAGGNHPRLLAWYRGNGSSHNLHPVAQLACNELGLYDMSGNVNEWTEIVPDVNSMAYYRGGDVDHVVDWCEISFRGTRDINTYFNHIGFRLAL